jgi:hypothetical protein
MLGLRRRNVSASWRQINHFVSTDAGPSIVVASFLPLPTLIPAVKLAVPRVSDTLDRIIIRRGATVPAAGRKSLWLPVG